MNYRYLFASGLLCMAFCMSAADRNIPKNYYSRLDGQSGAALKNAAYSTISSHTRLSYNSLWKYYPETDARPGTNQVWDIYDDWTKYFGSSGSAVSGMNREHSFPKSWWGGSKNDAYSDLFHLYPVNEKANSARSNWAYGEVDKSKTIQFDNGVSLVGYPVSGQGGGSTKVFEPDDRYKGDLARTYFYMVTCYQNLNWATTYMVDSNTYPTLNSWALNMLLRWHREDPVSQKEIDRNEAVYKNQGNRNPFIDFPELAEYVWGTHKTDKFVLADHLNGTVTPDPGPGTNPDPEPATTVTLLSPAQDFELNFGEVAIGHDGSARLLVRGENFTEGKNVRLAVYDTSETDDASLFTIDGGYVANISASAVNSPDGLNVVIDYRPDEIGVHESRLVISGAGLKGSVGIALKGECLPEPYLTAPTATAATDITTDSYVANWKPVEDEEVDYYIVNRTKYINGTATTEQIETEDTSLLIDNFCGSESYTVQSVRLEVESSESNSILVGQSSITGVSLGNRFGVSAMDGGVLITCSEEIPELRVADMSGRTVSTLYNVRNNDTVYLPAGIYVFIARGVMAPIKVVVSNF